MNFCSILFIWLCTLATVESRLLHKRRHHQHEDTGNSYDDQQNVFTVERLSRSFVNNIVWSYGKDNSAAYFMGYKIDGARASSFTSLGGGYGKDSSSAYFKGKKIDGASSYSFTALGGGYGK
ncbi:unnamed protein product, partial [Didymodactylos carnosus]